MAEYGSQAVVWQTAVNPVVALELLDSGAWSGAGVLGPEALPAEPFPRATQPPRRALECEERTPPGTDPIRSLLAAPLLRFRLRQPSKAPIFAVPVMG